MDSLRELYQEVILEHNKKPRNFREIPGALQVEGFNPLCGDHYTIYVALENDIIGDIGFQGSGCAISKSSASIMTTLVKGKSSDEARVIFDQFRAMVTRRPDEPVDAEALGKIAVFSQVCEFPARVKCASLPWHALHAALNGEAVTVSTE